MAVALFCVSCHYLVLLLKPPSLYLMGLGGLDLANLVTMQEGTTSCRNVGSWRGILFAGDHFSN